MKKRIWLILSILLVLIFWWIIIAQTELIQIELIWNKLYRWYKAVSSTTKWIINTWWTTIDSSVTTVFEHNICQKVVNTWSTAIFVPTRSEDEWFSFRTNLPPNTTLQGCGCYNDSNCPSGQFCQWATSTGSPYCAWYYQSVDYYCGWKPISQGSPPYVCMKYGSPYSLVPEFWCPSGRTLWFIQWWTIIPASETLCQYSNQAEFQLPNCEYKCDPYTTQTACQAESSFCSWLSRTTFSSCSSLTTQTTCQSKNGCTRNSWGTPIPWTCVVQTCWSAHGQTYSSLSITSPDLCNGWSATNFVTNTSNWTWKCGTASCSANKVNSVRCLIWYTEQPCPEMCLDPFQNCPCIRDSVDDSVCCCPDNLIDPIPTSCSGIWDDMPCVQTYWIGSCCLSNGTCSQKIWDRWPVCL